MSEKKIINRFDGNIIIVVLVLVIALAIYAIMGSPVATGITSLSNTKATAATGTYTFTGNVSNGELVNITNGAAVYLFEFNSTNLGLASICRTTNCIVVNLSGVGNYTYTQSVWASGNLTAAINANASTSALVTAVNTTNLTTLTAITTGTTGNGISLATNAAKITASGMSGAADGSDNKWSAGTQSIFSSTPTMTLVSYWLIPVVLILFVVRRAI